MTGETARPGKRRDSLLELASLVLQHPGRVALVGLLGIVVGVLGWGSAVFIQYVTDNIGRGDEIVALGAGVGLVACLRSGLAIVRRRLQLSLVGEIERRYSDRYLHRVFRVEPAALEAYSSSDLFHRLRGLEHLRHALEERVLGVVFDTVLVVVAAVVLGCYSLPLAGLALLGALFPALLVSILRASIRGSFENSQSRHAAFSGECLDAFRGVRDLQVADGGDWMVARLRSGYESAQSARIRHFTKLGWIGQTTSLLSGIVGILIVVWGAREVRAAALTSGELMFVVTMAGMMLGPLENLVVSWIFFEDAAAALVRAGEILNLPARAPTQRSVRSIVRGSVELENVSFSYAPGRNVLSGISFRVEAGETLAVVGESGAGKSTLLSLIAGVLHPNVGKVTIDGRDVRTMTGELWGSTLGAVFQDSHLFEGTIDENIRLGCPEASSEDVERAVSAAGALEFIGELPLGLQTPVTREGGTFSAGQVQRIALARALVRNPKILLLDEATSNLDARLEEAIWSALSQGNGSRTTIFITHRLASSIRADRILVLQNGCIAEVGSFSDLLKARGVFFSLWKRQHPETLG